MTIGGAQAQTVHAWEIKKYYLNVISCFCKPFSQIVWTYKLGKEKIVIGSMFCMLISNQEVELCLYIVLGPEM